MYALMEAGKSLIKFETKFALILLLSLLLFIPLAYADDSTFDHHDGKDGIDGKDDRE